MFLGGLTLSLSIAALGLLHQSPFQGLDDALLDVDVRLFASSTPARHAAVVDIDDVSLSAVGQWPWPRYRIASLIQRISEQTPAAIALDILFPEADRTSLANIQETYKRDFGIDVSIGGLPAEMLDNDGFLGQEIARAGVVGSNFFYFDHANVTGPPARPGVGFDGQINLLSIPDAPGVMTNAQSIASQTRVSGFVNTGTDHDGALRRLPMLIKHDGILHPSLSLAAVMQSLGEPSGKIEGGPAGAGIRIANHRVPVDPSGAALLRFDAGATAYPSISAVDVLNGKVDASAFRGKIVFVGSSAVGLNDYHRTAVDPRFPGLKFRP